MGFAFRLLAAPLLVLALTATAAADPPNAALRLYASGNYLAAASSAEDQASPSALVFAARALMAACMTSPQRSDVDSWLVRAEQSASEALELDPSSVEARLQLAFTLGARARRTSLAQAVAHNYAPRGKRLISEAITREPNNAQAHALMGAWHLEVLRRGGRTGATLYGARLQTGLTEFDRARALAPDDALIAVQYAVALLQLDGEAYAERISHLFAEADRQAPRDAFEAHAMSQARRIARVLDRDGVDAANAAARVAFL